MYSRAIAMFKSISHNSQSLRLQIQIQLFLPLKILLLLSIGAVEILLWASPVLTQENSNSETVNISQKRSRNLETVELKLTDVVQLVIQNNRELKNSYLSRITERQQLAEAEAKFSPTVTPNFSVSVNQSLSDQPSFEDDTGDFTTPISSAGSTTGNDDTADTGSENVDSGDFGSSDLGNSNFERSLQVGAELLTPIGTKINLTSDPISDFEVVGLEVRQSLLRGAGTKVNLASVKSARLTDTRQVLELKRTSIDRITEGVKAYRALIQAQEEVRIRQSSLESRRQDLQVQVALVESGRRARADLVQLRSSVASAEEQLLSALNSQSQANTDLLGIIDTDRNIEISIPQESIQALTDRNLFRPVELDGEDLLKQAYTQRPDYLQANLDLKIANFDVIEPKDNQRWQLDAVSNLNLGDSSQANAGLELTKTIGDRSLKTAFETARVDILQKRNDLKESKETVRIEVRDRITDVNSNLAQIEKARQAKELAQERLIIVQKLYRRGRGGIDIFELTSQQDQVVEAQNTELNAIVGYLDARTDLEQSLGTTLDTWQEFLP
jgi:outer membrane protein